mgnify:FL=1
MALEAPSYLNDQINALKRRHYASQSQETKEERSARRRAYVQKRRDFHIKNRSFVCHTCDDRLFSGHQELKRHLLGPRHLRRAFRMLPSTEEGPTSQKVLMPVEG